MTWYFEQMSPLGRWSPCTSPDEPLPVSVSGTKRTIRAVQKIEPVLAHLTLKQLHAVYSPDGHLNTNVTGRKNHD